MKPVTEEELAAKSVAPRVTMADIEAQIVSEHYFTAADGVIGTTSHLDEASARPPLPLELLTFCVLVLKNGFTVTGESACASPKNFNYEIGKRVAREKAIEKIWPLLGYELRTRLQEQSA